MAQTNAKKQQYLIDKIKRLLDDNLPIDISDSLSMQERITLYDLYELDTGNEPNSTLEAIDFIINNY